MGRFPAGRPHRPQDCYRLSGARDLQPSPHTATFNDPLNLRVRVTPGASRPLSRLDPGFRYRCWPGFRSRSKPFGLAASYVFIKQSGPPCHCDLPTPPRRRGRQAPLLPRLRGQFAEFPGPESPQTPWPSQPGAPVSDLGTVPRDRSGPPFHWLQGSAEAAYAAPSRLHLVLAVTALPRLQRLGRATALLGLPRSVRGPACVAAPTRGAPEC